jgi:hypothetical protein
VRAVIPPFFGGGSLLLHAHTPGPGSPHTTTRRHGITAEEMLSRYGMPRCFMPAPALRLHTSTQAARVCSHVTLINDHRAASVHLDCYLYVAAPDFFANPVPSSLTSTSDASCRPCRFLLLDAGTRHKGTSKSGHTRVAITSRTFTA